MNLQCVDTYEKVVAINGMYIQTVVNLVNGVTVVFDFFHDYL